MEIALFWAFFSESNRTNLYLAGTNSQTNNRLPDSARFVNLDAEKVVEQHYPRILRTAVLLTGDYAAGEDLAQETFLQALASWHRFRGKCSRTTWLYSILMNLHKKQIRARQRRWARWLHWFDRSDSQRVMQPEELAVAAEWKNSLWAAVAKLPMAQQHVVVLRYSDGLTYDAIASVLDCPTGTVKSRLNAALQKLNSEFSRTGEFSDITVGTE